ncbi:MAG: glycoside hydrolase family 97 catalytic domain-containing protein [Phycisphaerae bacterium]|nr:glycoside hydrolase family 97 catalytic domain-containing protein [Phycisphaerae bacterium]
MKSCLLSGVLFAVCAGGPGLVSEVRSAVMLAGPGGDLQVTFFVKPDKLMYSVRYNDAVVVENSPLGVTVDGVDLGAGAELLGQRDFIEIDETYPWRGVHAVAVNRYRAMSVPVRHKATGTEYTIQTCVFGDGIAFRYIIPGKGKRTVSGEATAFTLPAGSAIWYQTNTANYEADHIRCNIEEVKAGTFMGPPVTVELPGKKGFAAITEAALLNYSGMTLKAGGGASRVLAAAFRDDVSWTLDGTITTPWRVIMVSGDLNGLVNCDIVHNVCEPPAPELVNAEWIKPARALWHWWSGQIGNFDTVAFDRQMWWVDQAAKLGFENYLVDAGWEHTWSKPGKDKWALMKELVDYARAKGVDITVWKRWATGNTEGVEMVGLDDAATRRTFFAKCKEIGVSGIKIDFMDSECKERMDFYTNVLKDAAHYKLMINFHGANKPTGESRTWPNEITREGVKGLEYNKWSALKPDHYASLPFTRYLAGHGDFTPCTFNPKMLKGTTFALQLASAVVYTSPMLHWADNPEFYFKSPALDVIKAIPSTWDETIVLEGSKIGDLAAFARRKGDTWFIGVINGGDKRTHHAALSFLGKGNYRGVLLSDDPQRPDNLLREERGVDAQTALTIAMNAGGGFVAMLVPAVSADVEKPGWTLTFGDEFDGDALDLTKWSPRDPWNRERNNELQAYVPDAFEVKDGILKIKAEKRKAEYSGKMREYTSGMMSTYQKFTQKFGWFEIRCRIPKGKGLWPAFWLLPDPLGWPPEIDVLETLGHQTNRAYFTHHWRDENRKHQSHGGHVDTVDLSAGFHTYAAEWSPDVIVWYLDGKEAFRSTRSVPKELPMYMLANFAIGGNWPGAPTEDTPFPSTFDIDYIRVYTRK